MTELDLYKFIEKEWCEYHWGFKDKNSKEKDEVYLCVNFYALIEFNKMIWSDYLDDWWIDCKFLMGYVWFEMSDICENFEIDMKKVFLKDN